MYRSFVTQGNEFEALALLNEASKKHDIPTPDIALRWIQHHSGMIESDGVIVGASSVAQIRENCKASKGGPLPQELVELCEKCWDIVKPKAVNYNQ